MQNQHYFRKFFIPDTGMDTIDTTSLYIASHLGVNKEAEKELHDKIESYDQLQSKLAQEYLAVGNDKKRQIKNNSLNIINGWNSKDEISHENPHTETLAKLLLKKSSRNTASGFYIRWNDVGIVVNPGSCFLKNFHNQGFHLKDINHVVVTTNSPDGNADVRRIYDLNYQLNKLNPDLHVIHYYLSQTVYQELAPWLKPNFKQERNTLHSLELFLDSPDVEKEFLGEGITLNYFSANPRGNFAPSNDQKVIGKANLSDNLGIKFDLMPANTSNKDSITIGYISGTAWSPLLTHHLGPCDMLITGFGRTNPNDYGKLNYNDDCLGYYGTYSILEASKPKLLICGEFDGSDGDIRLEVIKKLSKEFQNHGDQPTILLPAEKGLIIDLNHLHIHCNVSETFVPPKEIRTIQTHTAFGTLRYLSYKCFWES